MHKVHFERPTGKQWSPYGCHYYPDPKAFPQPNLDSLPHEPLKKGEQYYLDLAGNICKVCCMCTFSSYRYKKVKFTLQPTMRAKRYSSTLSLTLALDRVGWLTPCPGCLIPRNYSVPTA